MAWPWYVLFSRVDFRYQSFHGYQIYTNTLMSTHNRSWYFIGYILASHSRSRNSHHVATWFSGNRWVNAILLTAICNPPLITRRNKRDFFKSFSFFFLISSEISRPYKRSNAQEVDWPFFRIIQCRKKKDITPVNSHLGLINLRAFVSVEKLISSLRKNAYESSNYYFQHNYHLSSARTHISFSRQITTL